MDIFDDCSVSDGMESDDAFTEDSEDSYDDKDIPFEFESINIYFRVI